MRQEPRTHDGLYVRLFAGPAYLDASGPEALSLSGPGLTLGLATGYAVREDLILFVEGRAVIWRGPSSGSEGPGLTDPVVVEAGFGMGLAFYFMPANLYASASLAAARLTLRTGDGVGDRSTGWGPGLSLLLGKEWWLGDAWGLGAAAQVSYSKLSDERSGSWGTTVVGVALSATFN
jgi:hypothetical protein